MQASNIPSGPGAEKARAQIRRFGDFSARYRDDASLRARLDGGDMLDSLEELGIDLPQGVQAKIVADTAETMHFVLPPDPNSDLADEAIGAVAGGKTVGSVGSVGSFACSCMVSSAGSVGTVGSADPNSETLS